MKSLSNGNDEVPVREVKQGAPTWSWASIRGRIYHDDWNSIPSDMDWQRRYKYDWCDWYYRAKVRNIRIKPKMDNAPFGQLKSAVLSLETKVLDLDAEITDLFDPLIDTEQNMGVLESETSREMCKLLLLSIVEVIKSKFSRRPRGLIVIESEKSKGEFKRVGIFIGAN
jgi:hypothetical protein